MTGTLTTMTGTAARTGAITTTGIVDQIGETTTIAGIADQTAGTTTRTGEGLDGITTTTMDTVNDVVVRRTASIMLILVKMLATTLVALGRICSSTGRLLL